MENIETIRQYDLFEAMFVVLYGHKVICDVIACMFEWMYKKKWEKCVYSPARHENCVYTLLHT